MEKILKEEKKRKISLLFKLCKKQRTKHRQLDEIIKEYNIDILTVNNRLDGLTLFQYALLFSNLDVIEYLYENGGYTENDFQYATFWSNKLNFKVMDWFLEKKLIKPTLTVTYKYMERCNNPFFPSMWPSQVEFIKKVEYVPINTIVYLLSRITPDHSCSCEIFDWIKNNFDIYEKDCNGNSILDLFKERPVFKHNDYRSNYFYGSATALTDEWCELRCRNEFIINLLKKEGVSENVNLPD